MLKKLTRYGVLAFSLLGLVLCFFVMKIEVGGEVTASLDAIFYLSYFLLAITVLVALFYAVKGLLSDAKALKQSLLFFGAFALLGVVAYVLALSEKTPLEQFVSGGLITTYLLLGVSLLVLVGGMIRNSLKR